MKVSKNRLYGYKGYFQGKKDARRGNIWMGGFPTPLFRKKYYRVGYSSAIEKYFFN